jgi:hypothetical protein
MPGGQSFLFGNNPIRGIIREKGLPQMHPRFDKVKERASAPYIDEPKEAQPQAEIRPRRPSQRAGVSLQERRSTELRKLQRARLAKRLWTLGERVEFEFVEHLIATFDLDEDAVIRIEQRFAGLDLEALRALGAERLPPSPLHQVKR